MVKNQQSSQENIESPKAQYLDIIFPDNKEASPLEGVYSMKIGVTWTLKHDISSPKFYELLIKT